MLTKKLTPPSSVHYREYCYPTNQCKQVKSLGSGSSFTNITWSLSMSALNVVEAVQPHDGTG